MTTTRLRIRLSGAGLLCVLAAAVLLVWALYHQDFTPTVNVTLLTDRAGLMMAPQDEVKFHGVVVGDVSSVSTRGQSAAMTLRIDPAQANLIPANAVAEIVPNTAFGNKYIGLSAPASGARGTVRTGTVLVSDDVATEVNTVFGNLVNVLNAANPAALNAALMALATALRGQGQQGQFLTGANSYLKEFNPSLPQLNRDVNETAQVSELYADVAPQFFQILGNGDKIGATVVSKQQGLDELLKGVAKVGATGTTLTEQNGESLVQALRLLEPTSSLLDEYSPELSCFIDGEAYAEGLLAPPLGEEGGARAVTNILPGKAPYTYPQNLPEVDVKEGPHCYGLPYLGSTPAPFYPIQGAGYGNINTGTSPGLQVGKTPASVGLGTASRAGS
jgi:phospholipid/cholesterol/gamma-HCH transport system substrate-binding protein